MTTAVKDDVLKVVVATPETQVKSLLERLDVIGFPAEFKARRPARVRTPGGERRFHEAVGMAIIPGTEDLPVMKAKVKKVEVRHSPGTSNRVQIVQHGASGKIVTEHRSMTPADEHIDEILNHHEHLDSVHHSIGGDEYRVFHDGHIQHRPGGKRSFQDLGKVTQHRDGTMSLRGTDRAQNVPDLLNKHQASIAEQERVPAKRVPAQEQREVKPHKLLEDTLNATGNNYTVHSYGRYGHMSVHRNGKQVADVRHSMVRGTPGDPSDPDLHFWEIQTEPDQAKNQRRRIDDHVHAAVLIDHDAREKEKLVSQGDYYLQEGRHAVRGKRYNDARGHLTNMRNTASTLHQRGFHDAADQMQESAQQLERSLPGVAKRTPRRAGEPPPSTSRTRAEANDVAEQLRNLRSIPKRARTSAHEAEIRRLQRRQTRLNATNRFGQSGKA